MNAPRFVSTLLLPLCSAYGCGDSAPVVDAMPRAVDAAPDLGDGAGVVCPDAKALYSGSLFAPAATDDGTELFFSANLDAATAPAKLVLRVPTPNPPAGTLPLPDSAWSVSICPVGGDSCQGELVAYSGNLQINSSEDRLQASLSEILFVDDLASPTCSAGLSQSTIDVAISGPP